MKKSLPLILLASILSACGGAGSSSSDTNPNTAEIIPKVKPTLTYDASKLAYFAIQHGNGAWEKLDNQKQDIVITDAKGDFSFIAVCDETGHNNSVDREIEISHTRLTENFVDSHWCKGLDSDSPKTISLASAQSNISISTVFSEGLISASNSSNMYTIVFSNLTGPKTIVASAYDYTAKKVYIYRKSYEQLKTGETYTIDFLGADAQEMTTFSTKGEENGFEYSYGYRPANSSAWDIDLYSLSDTQGKVPTDFIQTGDLFNHSYGFGNDSEISILSDKQTKAANPLNVAPTEYTAKDFTISDDKKSLSFTPKVAPIDSLKPYYHTAFINSYNIEYTIYSERFLDAKNTVSLIDFSSLPDYPGNLPAETITKIEDVTTYYKSSEIGKSGSQWLFISTN